MGAGILPTTIINNKIYFLFGKENKFETSAPGFSDFGGGTEKNETLLKTAIREASEELTGFLGDEKDIKKLLDKHGVMHFDYDNGEHSLYRMYIFPIEYDPNLMYYYNNNQRFIQKKLDDSIIKNTRIFEKAEIKWFSIDELIKSKSKFRHYFIHLIELILENRIKITQFIKKSLNKSRGKTFKNR
jgi:8-oxo-dGTP pyrophosphatase MutT (NUDIX family)